MKKITLLFVVMCMIAIGRSLACPTVTVQDSISTNTHWTHDNQYLLKGWVYVTAGTTLTIDAGVIIRGDKATKSALIVERGAKIICNGTAEQPIVFTSNQPAGARDYGDWGGLVLLGKAPNNWNGGDQIMEGGPRSHYGGTDPHDNSGKISYVRIEFAGIAFSPNNEVNGLTLCSVGDGTQIDHVFIGYSGDDGIEFFGGNVNIKYAVSYRSWDDDFDQDNGYRGKVQFGVVIRDPLAADASGSKAFEADSYQSGTATGLVDTTMLTRAIFSNMTIIGPVAGTPAFTGYSSNFVSGIQLRRGNATSLINSVIAGWPCGVLIDESSSSYGSTVANIGNGALQIRNTIVEGTATAAFKKDVMFVKDGARSLTSTAAYSDTTSTGTDWSSLTGFSGPNAWFYAPVNGNKYYSTEGNGTKFFNPWNLTKPNIQPNTASPLCFTTKPGKTFDPTKALDTNAATFNAPDFYPNFTTSKAADPFFDKVNFVGAVSCNNNWLLEGWVNFDCQSTVYTDSCMTVAVPQYNSNSVALNVFPNPANTSATIEATLPRDSKVFINLMDVNGRLVKVISKDEQKQGNLKINIDLTDVPAGTYFVTFHTIYASKTLNLTVTK